jgi:hypothetical protein
MSEPAAETPVKPGYKTTEFWISVTAAVAGALAASGVFPSESAGERILGLIVSVLVALGYTGSRLALKKKNQY